MIKIYVTFASLLTFACGWFFFTWISITTMKDCISKNIIIYDEPDRYIVSRSTWYTWWGGNEHKYSAQVLIDGPRGKLETFSSERVIETEYRFNFGSINVSTIKSFRIAGPLINDPRTEKYIDPQAKEGFTGRIYLSRYKDSCILSGFKGVPLNLCL